MKKILVLILAVACCAAHAQKKDWLIDGSDYKAQATLLAPAQRRHHCPGQPNDRTERAESHTP